MKCPYCTKEAEWIPNEQVYGKRYGKSYMCYYCRACDVYVGCHNNTTEPLGTMANKKLRQMRRKTHEFIDTYWLEGKYDRSEMYTILSEKLGFDVHVGESDEETCEKIIKVAKESL